MESRTMIRSLWCTWHSMWYRLSKAYRFTQLLLGATSYKNEPPPDDVVSVAKNIISVMESNDLSEEDLIRRAGQLLDECFDLDALLEVTDDNGYNLLQMAVISKKESLLTLFLELGLDPNTTKCSPPLHLACYLGYLPLVQTLILHGANPNHEAGMCYPNPHVPVRHVPSRFHFLETDIFLCDGMQKPPLLYAIQNDHIDLVKLLISEENVSEWPLHQYPLHYACQCGSLQSVKYLMGLKPSELHITDLHGITTLHYAVKWGKEFVQYLVEAGVNVHGRKKHNKTALHWLFTNTQSPEDIFETTNYLLGMGLEQDTAVVDDSQNSALHELITHVNYLVTSYTNANISQTNYDGQILDTLDLLAKNNCDFNQVNSSGITALQKLLLTFEFVASNDQTGLTLEILPVREQYKVDFGVLHRALSLLLHHGADPNLTTSADRSALHIFLQTVLNVDPGKLDGYKQDYFDCILLLCSYGAHPSYTPAIHKSTVAILKKLGHKCLATTNESLRNSMSNFLKELLGHLAINGLNCNHKIVGVKETDASGCGNILVDIVSCAQFIRQPSDLQYIYTWVLTLIQNGANPDIEPYQADPIICHSQSSIYLKSKSTQAVNQYMYEIQDLRRLLEGGHAQRLLLLFFHSMQHESLFQSINSAKFMSRFDDNRVPSSHFLKMLNSLLSQPRSLQQIARVAIYVAIDRQLLLRVPRLPIPRRLQHYLINVQ